MIKRPYIYKYMDEGLKTIDKYFFVSEFGELNFILISLENELM